MKNKWLHSLALKSFYHSSLVISGRLEGKYYSVMGQHSRSSGQHCEYVNKGVMLVLIKNIITIN